MTKFLFERLDGENCKSSGYQESYSQSSRKGKEALFEEVHVVLFYFCFFFIF